MSNSELDIHCPRLIRVFVRTTQPYDAYSFDKGLPSKDEYDVLAGPNTTIRELLLLLQKSLPENLRHPRSIYSVRTIYVDMKAMYHKEKDLGRYSLSVKNYSDKYDDQTTLDEAKIYPGDYLSVHLQLPYSSGASRRPPSGPPGRRPPVDNGYSRR